MRSRRLKNERAAQAAVVLLLPALLNACSVAATPCRVASAGIDAIPVIGTVAALPTDACADAIDP